MSESIVFVELHDKDQSYWINIQTMVALTPHGEMTEVRTTKGEFYVDETVDEIFKKVNNIFQLMEGADLSEGLDQFDRGERVSSDWLFKK